MRDPALDLMRGVAILLMVQIHLLLHLRPGDSGMYMAMGSLGTLAAPFFLICAGMGNGYMQQRHQNSDSTLRSILLRRGLFLVLFPSILGLLYHLDISQAVAWDIFTLIGAMYLVVGINCGIKLRGALMALGIVLLLNHFLSVGSPVILRGGPFPIIPFAAYFLVGIIFAQLRQLTNQKKVICIAMPLSMVILLIIVFFQGTQILRLTRYDVWNAEGVFGISALYLLTLNIARLLQAWPLFAKNNGFLIKFGNVSFSLYYIQFLILIIIPRLLESVVHQKLLLLLPTIIWFILLFLLYVFLYAMVVVWSHYGYQYGLEWFMNKYISKRTTFPT